MENNKSFTREAYHLEKANILSKLFFLWLRKICSKSLKYDFNFNDLHECSSIDKSDRLTDIFESNWNYEIIKTTSQNRIPSLLGVIRKTFFWHSFFYSNLFVFKMAILTPLQPVLLAKFIHLFSVKPSTKDENEHHMKLMYIFGGLIVLLNGVSIILGNHLDYLLPRLGMRIRIACSALVYRKILRLSTKSLSQSSSGHVINLLSNDVSRFDTIGTTNYLLVVPLLLLISAAFVWQQMQISGVIGFGLFLLTLPFQALIGKCMAKLNLRVAQKTDLRVEKLSEIFSGIRLIKMYAWEKPFEGLVNSVRIQEISIIKQSLVLMGVVISSFNFTARLILFITVTIYTLTGNEITAAKVFSISLIYNILQENLTVMLPIAINRLTEILVSIKRIQEFLLLKEVELPSISSTLPGEICLKDICISWNSEFNVLQNINMKIKSGSLCAVIGPVGVGKSTLLQFLLGESHSDQGTVSLGGSISYASQIPWLFASTAKRNILFGQDYDKNRYQNVVDVCSLTRDFQLFPEGDKTLVGEKGMSLSGGQKARINLARTVYRKSNIYLLDDPLSAVDSHVANELFENCIVDYLRGTTRILVTHQLQYLKHADHIVVLHEGQIKVQGTFEDISRSHIDFPKLLKFYEFKSTSEVEEYHIAEISLKKCTSMSDLVTKVQNDVSVEEPIESPKRKKFIFWQFINTGQHRCLLLLVIVLLICAQALTNCSDLWLTFWTDRRSTNISYNMTMYYTLNSSCSGISYYYGKLSINDIISAYAVIISTLIIVSIIACVLFYNTINLISYHLHNKMFDSLLHVPIKFFDVHPSGKILNRFSRDVGIVDQILPPQLHWASVILLTIIGTLVMVVIANPYIIIAILLLAFGFNKLRQWYIIVAQNMKHLESAAKSPVYSYINATWDGVITIRAAEMETLLKIEFDSHQDTHTSAWNTYIACIAAFGLWIDLLNTVFLFCVTFSFIILNQFKIVHGSYAGLAISQTALLAGTLQFGIGQIVHVVSQLTSVERILEFSNTAVEKTFPLIKSDLNSSWPHQGKIEFINVYLQYSPTDYPVLKNLNFTVSPGEKIGIVGRTGAGKSSLISVLFRLAPIEGNILIDDVDIEDISLEDLRSNITIIPQDPVLFSTSLRYNLDPLELFSDEEIWNALEDVELKSSISSLNFTVDEGGSNFSGGQRQLICLARAILRKNKILVLDEATASIDHKTDQLIQNTIRTRFKDCTVLTVAHRLNTIMDSDKIVVMDSGKIVEYDSPSNLLENSQSYFCKMVADSTGLVK